MRFGGFYFKIRIIDIKKFLILALSLALLIYGVIYFMNRNSIDTELEEIEITDTLAVQQITYKYGIPIDYYEID